ncbi:glucose-1-phosphate adenylyltransferase [Candidatus Nitromaritima sp. SCGC AAA799-A02]|nr:glucose-1-phosphate adenylyltransferase [Candidatus Nitromaritima sp. SCGC AAA799-A02]
MNILGMILAGGEGSRLFPLTQERAKPAVPFGGKYRLIDFVLSNFINSSIYSIYVLTQFKSQSLTEHLHEGWRFSSLLPDHFILPVPAQQRTGASWYSGTADAIFQNINLFESHNYDLIAIFGADHIYRMDIGQMVEFHRRKKAHMTVSAIPVSVGEASSFGVLEVDSKQSVIGFKEKPKKPKPIPGRPQEAYASMGNYIFDADFLVNALYEDAEQKDSSHDFGKDILPRVFKTSRVFAYDFRSNRIPQTSRKEIGYWRDVGTIRAFWEANMDLRNVKPTFNLYNNKWPIKSAPYEGPPAKFVFNEDGRRGQAVNSTVAEGSIISGGIVQDSVIGRDVRIDSGAAVINSLIMDEVRIGKNCKINMAIIDKHANIPAGTTIGYNLEEDKKLFYVDEESGITVIQKNFKFPKS